MSTDIANWLLVNIVSNPQVFRSLIALIILIVAIFLFSKKPTEKDTFRHGLGASLFVFAIFAFLFANIADLADVFTAWATIVLAGVAVFSFEESRRLRKQYKEREERDRKERKLITIIEWTTDIAKCETAAPLPPLPIAAIAKNASKLGKAKIDAIIEYRDTNTNTNLIMRYQNLDVMGTRMVLIAQTLDKQFSCNLEGLAKKTAKKLQAHVKFGPKWIAGKVTDDEYKKHWKSLLGSANSLAEKAEEVMAGSRAL